MRSSSLIRLGSLTTMVGGFASTMLGLLYVLQAQGLTLDSIENALLKGNYEIVWALLGLPWVLVGYALFQAGARLSERPSRVR